MLTPEQRAEIQETREQTFTTRRVTVPELEEILYSPFEVLDHGFVRAIDYFGNDAAIAQAARVSYGKGTKKVRGERGLIRYLMRHRHTTPFEMCEIKFHAKMPFFVARQWVRHRTANINEYSARYSILDKEFYIPTEEQLAAQSKKNRQGRGKILSENDARTVQELLREDAETAYTHYEWLLNENQGVNPRDPNRTGIARELARMDLPLNYYTQWYWKIDLHNLLHFLSLRADPHAQYEIRVYAEEMLKIVQKWVPLAAEAFDDFILSGVRLSKQAQEILRKRIQTGSPAEIEKGFISNRELQEISSDLGIPPEELVRK